MDNKNNKLNILKSIVKSILILLIVIFAIYVIIASNKSNITTNTSISTDIKIDEKIEESTEETVIEYTENKSELINNILESEFIVKNISNPRVVELTTINENNADSYEYNNQLCIVSGEADEKISNNISNFSLDIIFDKDNTKLESLQVQFEIINNIDMSMQYISEVSTMLSGVLNNEEINSLAISNIEKDIIINGDTFKASQSTNNTNESIIIIFKITKNKLENSISIEEIKDLNLDIPTLPRIANNYLDDKFIEKLNTSIVSNTIDKEDFNLDRLSRYITSSIEDNTMIYKSSLTGTVVTISNSIMKKDSSNTLENDNYSISIQFSESSDDFLKEKAVELSKELFNREITKENILEIDNNTYTLSENNVKVDISNNSLMISTDYSTIEEVQTVETSETVETSK